MSFLAICGIVFLVGFICYTAFLLGQEFGYGGIPEPVDFFACIARGIAFSIVTCSPILLLFAMLIIGAPK